MTLLGRGSIGKTHLALQIAADLAPHFHDRSAVMATVAAPLPIALDELAALAEFELSDQPDAALAALVYVQSHPLTQPVARARAGQHSATAEQRAHAEALARSFPLDQPSALLSLFH